MSDFLPALGEKVVARRTNGAPWADHIRAKRTGMVVGFGFHSNTAIVTLPIGTLEIKYDDLHPLGSIIEAEWAEYRHQTGQRVGFNNVSKRDFIAGWNAREAA